MKKKVLNRLSLALAAALVAPGATLALNAPVAGTLAFDVYDIAVNSILKGPIGFVIGAMAVAGSAALFYKAQYFPAIGALLAGASIIKADSIVTTLGALVG